MTGFKKLQEKWIKKWHEHKVFEAHPDKKKKFFGTFPYPYINLYPHIGHFYSLMKLEAFSRYKRMRGYNVLYSQAWHATGSPIVNAAKRVINGEQKQIDTLKKMGFSDEDIKKFEDPKHWIKVFGAGWQEDLTNAGCSIDWRRNFHTTSLNPHYNKFIAWQFRKLKEHGKIVKGKKPVIYCTNCKQAIGDHARTVGEGETPQEFTLLKMKFEDSYIICATLRPETVYGQTNIWVDPDAVYWKVRVNDSENWICSKECVDKLKLQDKKIERLSDVKASELIGKFCLAPGIERKVIILPSGFCDSKLGTGIVTSVPSDSPDDYMGLRDLQNDKEECEKYGLNHEEIKNIKPIPIINTEEWGDMAAVKICNDWNIENQHDREKLNKAKKVVYKAGYHLGTVNELYGKYSGKPVEEVKDYIKKELLDAGKADLMYEPSGKVVCRCLQEAVVKIVKDQWFLAYSDEEWKKQAHECLDSMKLWPEKSRTQFNYVIDWLNDWACTHHSDTELGTALPWDNEWVVESLSDSTIYMAYYTIAHLIKEIDPEKIDDAFFDYIFLDNGDKPNIENIDKMKAEFEYWYPMDYRTSGKDLIQNHLTFCIFNHCDIFPKKHWPQGFAVNGWVTVDGNKMSKSLGNVIPVRKMISEFGSDASRFTVLSGGEGLDDANWDSELALSMKEKLPGILEFTKKYYNRGRDDIRPIDKWLDEQLKLIIKDCTDAYEANLFRTAIQKAYYEIGRVLKWYLKRTEPNKKNISKAIETQILLLAPITPFICEEAWEAIGKDSLISVANWPKVSEKIDYELINSEKVIENTIQDINSVLKLVKIEPKKATLFVSDEWKYELLKELGNIMQETRKFPEIMQKIMSNAEYKPYAKAVTGIIQKFVKSGSVPDNIANSRSEFGALNDAKEFLEKQFKLEIKITMAKDSKESKSNSAMPGKPAILVE